jgi:HD-like signal output (HDOD) protein
MPAVEISPAESEARLARFARTVDEISTLPHVAMRVLEVAQDPDASVSQLKGVLEQDVSLTARVLRCVNSSLFGLRVKVTNLQTAVAYLGFNQVRNLAVTASVAEIFRGGEPIGTYHREELWKHLVSVGICARMIAMRQRLQIFEDAFLAGLLHDIGIVLLDQHAHTGFCEVIAALKPNVPLVEVEKSILGFDHTEAGERIATSWKFPEAARDAIRYHHRAGDYRGEHGAIVRCVELANGICTLKGISSVGMKLAKVSPTTLSALGVSREDLLVLANDLDAELTRSAELFSM